MQFKDPSETVKQSPAGSVTRKGDDAMTCPHCNADMGDPVADFSVPGRRGEISRAEDECGNCDKRFAVSQLDDTTFLIEKL